MLCLCFKFDKLSLLEFLLKLVKATDEFVVNKNFRNVMIIFCFAQECFVFVKFYLFVNIDESKIQLGLMSMYLLIFENSQLLKMVDEIVIAPNESTIDEYLRNIRVFLRLF